MDIPIGLRVKNATYITHADCHTGTESKPAGCSSTNPVTIFEQGFIVQQ